MLLPPLTCFLLQVVELQAAAEVLERTNELRRERLRSMELCCDSVEARERLRASLLLRDQIKQHLADARIHSVALATQLHLLQDDGTDDASTNTLSNTNQ